jgi:hypothetical protein
LADKPTQLILDALGRAAADPGGLTLFQAKGGEGLFPATATARQAAQRCRDEGLLRVEPDPANPGRELGVLTAKGMDFLLSRTNPRQVLEDFVRALEVRHGQVAELVAAARRMQDGVEGLRTSVAQVLAGIVADAPAPSVNGFHAPEPAPDWAARLLDRLDEWHLAGCPDDCPLPELYRRAAAGPGRPTIGAFHDALRRLHDEGRVYLHPWTGPLYALPEPAFALLVGHEIAYYASLRGAELGTRTAERDPGSALRVPSSAF